MLNSYIADIPSGGELPVDSDVYSAKLLRNVYIHEAIHYLGITDNGLFDNFVEAITESLCSMVITYAGIEYEHITGYSEIQGLGNRVITADPDLVRAALGGNSTGEHFDEVLGGDYAHKLDALSLVIRNGGEDAGEAKYLAQFIVNEYIKASCDNPYELQKSAERGTVSFFELKWLFGKV